MKRIRLSAVMLAMLIGGAAWADSIDDAEAKRRGVPVAVIQIEKQTAAEKTKSAALEKQVAEVEKKIADLKAPKAAGAKSTPGNLDPQLPKPADGPRKASPLYDEFVNRYLSGDWSKLNQDLAARTPQMGGLPAGNAADMAYIRAAVLECRPAWWDKVKAGAAFSFEATVFNRKLPVSWSAANQYSDNAATRSGKVIVLAAWPAQWMDTTGALDPNLGLLIPPGSYTDFEFTQFAIWQGIGRHCPMVELGEKGVALLDKTDEHYVDLHRQFIGVAAAMYYVTPASRYVAVVECHNAWDPPRRNNATWNGRRYFTAFLVGEFLAHPEKYPSIKLDIPELGEEGPKDALPEQNLFTSFISNALMTNKLTLAEDCALRQAIWEFALANTDWTADHITLPVGGSIAFDAAKETEAANGRWAAYRDLSRAKAAPAVPASQPAK